MNFVNLHVNVHLHVNRHVNLHVNYMGKMPFQAFVAKTCYEHLSMDKVPSPMSVCSAIPVQRSMHFAALQIILPCTSKDTSARST